MYLLPNNILQKTKANTLEDTTVELHHESIGNRPGVTAHLELLLEESQIFFSF
jgi:hypothetical protein